MRFSANVSILFKEAPFLERFALAAEAGFGAVEFWWPTGEDLGEVEQAVKEFRSPGGALQLRRRGYGGWRPGTRERSRRAAAIPGERTLWRWSLARLLDCRRMNALLGHEIEGIDREEQLALARENVGFAADEAHKVGIEVVVEAVNTFENGPYLIYTTNEAVEFVESLERGNVAIQHDFYHMQRMEGGSRRQAAAVHRQDWARPDRRLAGTRGAGDGGDPLPIRPRRSRRARLRRLRWPGVQPHHGDDRRQLRLVAVRVAGHGRTGLGVEDLLEEGSYGGEE